MALLQGVGFSGSCILGLRLLGQWIDIAPTGQFPVSLLIGHALNAGIQCDTVAAGVAEIAAVLVGVPVEAEMILPGAMVAAEGTTCLNLVPMKGSRIEDKPAPSGSVQNGKLLILPSQAVSPLSGVMPPWAWYAVPWDAQKALCF